MPEGSGMLCSIPHLLEIWTGFPHPTIDLSFEKRVS
jgi:hypothetical protein